MRQVAGLYIPLRERPHRTAARDRPRRRPPRRRALARRRSRRRPRPPSHLHRSSTPRCARRPRRSSPPACSPATARRCGRRTCTSGSSPRSASTPPAACSSRSTPGSRAPRPPTCCARRARGSSSPSPTSSTPTTSTLLDDAGARDLVEEIVILEGSVPAGTVSWADFLARGAGRRRRATSRRARRRSTGDTMCDIIFTSGTTGAPKGAMLRHGASVRAVRVVGRGRRAAPRRPLPPRLPVVPHRGAEVGPARVVAHRRHAAPPPRVRPADGHGDGAGRNGSRCCPGPPAIYQTILNADRQRVRPVVAAAGGHRRRGRPGRARGEAARASSASTPWSPATGSPRPPAPSPCAATTTTPRSSPTPRAARSPASR